MNEFKLKEQICEIGRRLYNRGFAAANDGNITIRLNEREILCTPTMVSKGFMKPEDICKVDYEGKQLAGSKRRTSEVLLHLAVYMARPDVNAVVHCHPPHATAFAVAREPIPKCVLPEVEVLLGEVPMARYETPGGQKYADPRFKNEDCDLCGNSVFNRGYSEFVPQPKAFVPEAKKNGQAQPSSNGNATPDIETLVKTITDQVMASLAGAK